jgi:ribosomal protein S27AE
MDKKRALAEKIKSQMAEHELLELKTLHHNHCSNCGFEMHPIVFKGVTIQQCPNCAGIFLAAEELETLAGKEGGFVSAVLSIFQTEGLNP